MDSGVALRRRWRERPCSCSVGPSRSGGGPFLHGRPLVCRKNAESAIAIVPALGDVGSLGKRKRLKLTPSAAGTTSGWPVANSPAHSSTSQSLLWNAISLRSRCTMISSGLCLLSFQNCLLRSSQDDCWRARRRRTPDHPWTAPTALVPELDDLAGHICSVHHQNG